MSNAAEVRTTVTERIAEVQAKLIKLQESSTNNQAIEMQFQERVDEAELAVAEALADYRVTEDEDTALKLSEARAGLQSIIIERNKASEDQRVLPIAIKKLQTELKQLKAYL